MSVDLVFLKNMPPAGKAGAIAPVSTAAVAPGNSLRLPHWL